MEAAKMEKSDLELSLLRIHQEHQHRHLRIREQAEKAKKDALTTAMRVSELLVDAVDGGVQKTFLNEKRIEHEVRGLVGAIARYKRQTDCWLGASHAMNSVLKEIGDFENWMKVMDYDCRRINAAIRNIHHS